MSMRGKCHEMSTALVESDQSLRLVRGYYFCPIWNVEEQHWWTEKSDGTVIDPTKSQFPSNGCGIYREFDGIIVCEECGTEFTEDSPDAVFQGTHGVCSGECYGRMVGIPIGTIIRRKDFD